MNKNEERKKLLSVLEKESKPCLFLTPSEFHAMVWLNKRGLVKYKKDEGGFYEISPTLLLLYLKLVRGFNVEEQYRDARILFKRSKNAG